MLVSINGFALADNTIAGGVALSQARYSVERIFDIVVPVQGFLPVPFNRNVRRTTVDFQVTRSHDTLEHAEQYIADHDAAIPSSGPVQFTTTNGGVRYMLNAALIRHQLIGEIGKTTEHSYHIEGGRFSEDIGTFFILTETGDYIIEEDSDRIETE